MTAAPRAPTPAVAIAAAPACEEADVAAAEAEEAALEAPPVAEETTPPPVVEAAAELEDIMALVVETVPAARELE